MAISVHVLLVYSLADQKLLRREAFNNAAQAMKAYVQAEREHLKADDVEIVLIGADSQATIETTHSSYFRGDVTVESLDLDKLLVP
jgi:hypothetical protein